MSLRARLATAVFAALAVVLAVFSAILYSAFGSALIDQLDDRLAGEAAALAGMVESSPLEFEYAPIPEFDPGPRAAYFEIWGRDGGVIARSPSLGARDLRRVLGFAATTLPDGRPGRAHGAVRAPRPGDRPAPGVPPPVTVVVAAGTEAIDAPLARVRSWLSGLAALAVIAATGAVLLAVARGLRPAQRLAAEIEKLDADALGRPLAARDVPAELRPVVDKLDGLLARLAGSFARERQFTADVSHELRTPLAALRTILEVTAARDRPPGEVRAAFAEAHAVVVKMQALADSLLALARVDAGRIDVRRRRVPLRPLVDDCFRPHAAEARRRGLTFANELAAAAAADTDPDKLAIVVANLIANAVAYTAEGGTITVRDGAGALVEVVDTGPPIPAELLPRVFDRFVRGDAARTGGDHHGLGLALVRGLCGALALDVAAENRADGSVAFRVTRPAPDASPPA
jgi:signal transduction histidine kinase